MLGLKRVARGGEPEAARTCGLPSFGLGFDPRSAGVLPGTKSGLGMIAVAVLSGKWAENFKIDKDSRQVVEQGNGARRIHDLI